VNSWFTIARVLPGPLGLNGSAANAEIIATALKHQGHNVSLVDIASPADVISAVDVVCVGSGSGSQIRPAATELIGLVRALTLWQQQGAWFFAVGTGWDLLGRHLVLADGGELPGAGIFPSSADHSSGRFSGEVAGVDYRARPSAGYINQVGRSTLEEGVSPLMTVTSAAGDYPAAEGLVGPNMMATRLGGPALALNPHWLDDIVEGLLRTRGARYQPDDFQHRVVRAADQARAKIEARLASKA
jgi:CobQ-like glutamine amidotransferase family enzyme